MAQKNEMVDKITEFNSMFLTLNEGSQDNALNILRALKFAQTVMDGPDEIYKKQSNCLYNQ